MSHPCCVEELGRIAIKSSSQSGRYTVAKRDYTKGQVIFSNYPSNYLLSSEYWGQKCLRCFSNGDSEQLLRCAKCKQASYCCKPCQVADWAFHKAECAHVNGIFEQNLPASAANEVLLLLRSINISSKVSEKCQQRDSDGVLCGKEHMGNVFYNPMAPVDTADLLLASVTGRFCKEPNAFLLRRLQQFHCNNFGITDELMNCLGSAEYPATALLNHSCAPNVVLRYMFTRSDGPIVEVVALRSIKSGDELCHSYTDCSSPTNLRRERLRTVSNFTCRCVLCVASTDSERPAPPSATYDALRSALTDPLTVRRVLAEAITTSADKLLVVDPLLTETYGDVPSSIINEQRDVEQRALAAESEGDMAAMCAEMIAMEERLQTLYGPYHQDLYLFRCKLLSTVLLTQDNDLSRTVCAKLVSYQAVAMVNVPLHPLLAVQLFTLADLYQSLGDEIQARDYYAWCAEILAVTHGARSNLVAHLQQCSIQN